MDPLSQGKNALPATSHAAPGEQPHEPVSARQPHDPAGPAQRPASSSIVAAAPRHAPGDSLQACSKVESGERHVRQPEAPVVVVNGVSLRPLPGRPGLGRDSFGVIRSLTPKEATPDERANYVATLLADYPFSASGSREFAADQWQHVDRLRRRADGKRRPSALLLAELGRAEGRLQRARKACHTENVANRPADWAARKRREEQAEAMKRLRGEIP